MIVMFGTKLIPISFNNSTSLQWEHVKDITVTPVDQTALTPREVNHWVNNTIQYVPDFHRDHWQTARETLERGKGDCEDFAILKYQILRSHGWPLDKMWIVIGRDIVYRRDHAVLVIEDQDHRMYVLDNTTDRLYEPNRQVGLLTFMPQISFQHDGSFTHSARMI